MEKYQNINDFLEVNRDDKHFKCLSMAMDNLNKCHGFSLSYHIGYVFGVLNQLYALDYIEHDEWKTMCGDLEIF